MNYLLENYYKSCKTLFAQYGFKKKNKAFSRVTNDVMQNFVLEKLKSGRTCRVEFAVIPLCLRIEKEYISGGVYSHNLRKFESSHFVKWDEWEYDPKSEESMDVCINEIIRYLTSYLIPFFERTSSCETALPELIKLEKLFHHNRKESLRISGIEDRAYPSPGFRLSDSVKYYISLKTGDFEFALKSRKALLQQNVDSYNSMFEKGYLTEEEQARREKSITKLRDEINRIENKDVSYIRRIIIENEAYSKEVLKSIM